jgi:hypothetical protein
LSVQTEHRLTGGKFVFILITEAPATISTITEFPVSTELHTLLTCERTAFMQLAVRIATAVISNEQLTQLLP